MGEDGETIPSDPARVAALAERVGRSWGGADAANVALYSFRRLGSTMDWVNARLRDGSSEDGAGFVGTFGGAGGPSWIAALAEKQTSGRGRNQRQWQSARSSGLYLSIGRALPRTERSFAALPLIAAVGVRRAVRQLGFAAVRIKWPNDLLAPEGAGAVRKLGGILVEGSTRGDSSGIVVGVGLNLVSDETVRQVGGIALEECLAEGRDLPQYAECAAAVVRELAAAMNQGLQEGFGPFRTEWLDGAALLGCEGVLTDPASGAVVGEGTIVTVDEEGALVLEERGGRTRRFVSGELSLRAGGVK